MNRRGFLLGLGAAAGLVVVEPVRRIWAVGAKLERPATFGDPMKVYLNGVEYGTVPAAEFSLQSSPGGKTWGLSADLGPIKSTDETDAEFIKRVVAEYPAPPKVFADVVTPESIKAQMVEQMREWERLGYIVSAEDLAASYSVKLDPGDSRRVIETYSLPQFKELSGAITFKT